MKEQYGSYFYLKNFIRLGVASAVRGALMCTFPKAWVALSGLLIGFRSSAEGTAPLHTQSRITWAPFRRVDCFYARDDMYGRLGGVEPTYEVSKRRAMEHLASLPSIKAKDVIVTWA